MPAAARKGTDRPARYPAWPLCRLIQTADRIVEASQGHQHDGPRVGRIRLGNGSCSRAASAFSPVLELQRTPSLPSELREDCGVAIAG